MRHLFLLLCCCAMSFVYGQHMDNEQLQQILTKQSDSIQEKSRLGYWQFFKEDVVMLCVTDTKSNRMRIISPITNVEQLDTEQLLNALTANFHTALDVKYAISDNILWSVFIHPLKELTDHQVTDAIQQVYRANLTFGFTYSSTDLVFSGKSKEEQQSKEEEKPSKPLKQSKL